MTRDELMVAEFDELEGELRGLTRWDDAPSDVWKGALAMTQKKPTTTREAAHRFFGTKITWRLPIAAVLAIATVFIAYRAVRPDVPRGVYNTAPVPNPVIDQAIATRDGWQGGRGRQTWDWADRQFTSAPDDAGLVNGLVGTYVEGIGGGAFPGKRAPTGGSPPLVNVGGPGVSDLPADRSVLHRALIEIATADVRIAFFKASSFVHEDQGEFVAASQINGEKADELHSTLTLRVRSGRVSAVMELLRDLGDVANEQMSADDVTAQVVDLEARIRNERRIETEVLGLLESVQSPTLKDVLTLRQELAQVRERIERLVAEQQHINRLVELATISVVIRPPAKPAPEPPKPVTKSAMEQFTGMMSNAWTEGLTGLGAAIGFIVSAAIGGLPWWILLAVIVIALRRAWQRRIEAGLA